MDVQIDNKKMWKSLIRLFGTYTNLSGITQQIIKALKEQGLTYDEERKEIVCIEPEVFLEKGKWYMCIKDVTYRHCLESEMSFKKGEVYYCNQDGYLANYVLGTCNVSDKFRPVTESEVEDCMETRFRAGDVVMYVSSHPSYSGLYLLAQSNDLHIGYDNTATPYNIALRNCTIANDWQRMQFMEELERNGYKWDGEKIVSIEPKPKVSWDSVNGTLRFDNLTNEQAEKLKSALIGEPKQDASEELTEFVSALRDHISVNNGEWIDDVEEDAKDIGKRLMELARKQMTSEIDVNSMVNNIRELIKENSDGVVAHLTVCGAYRMGIEDTLNKIKGR